MPSGVGAPLRAARIVIAASLAAASIAILATPAHAQAAPPTGGIVINKIEIGDTAPATFEVTGPGIAGTATLLANVVAENTPTPALPALPPLTPGTYTITETAPVDENGQSVWELTSVVCDGEDMPVQGNSVQVVVADAVIPCTFTDTVTRSEILGLKVVSGDTSTWIRPAIIHISCPAFQLEQDIPVGPGGPGTYTLGQGSIPPATCTLSEPDTGSNGFVQVSMIVTDHGIPVATGTTSVTFTSVAGGDLVIRVTNAFALPERPEQPVPTSTTVAGGSTTTTTIASTTTTTTATTVPSGGSTTTPGGGQPTSAPTSTPSELPTTGGSPGPLIAAALAVMILGLALVARTRRFAD